MDPRGGPLVRDFLQPAMSAVCCRPLRILLVEDHEDTRKLLRTSLERRGHCVLTASTVEQSLALLRETRADVLLSDIGLPDGDGWQLLQSLHAQPPAFAIAMSGFGSANDRARSLAAGYHAHLVKPFKCADLLRLLDMVRPAGAPAPVP